MNDRFAEINLLPQHAKCPAYVDLLKSFFASSKPIQTSTITQFVANIVQDSIGLLISKTVLSELVELINTEVPEINLKKGLIQAILDEPNLSGRGVRFEEQVSSLRETLASLLEDDEDWSGAARALQAIPLDGSHRMVSEEYKLKTYIRIVRLMLEDDDATSAESYLNRASLLIPTTKDEATILAFKLSQARIFDSKRKFEEASKKYHEISFVPNLAEEEREHCLSAALVCAVLSPAGPNRSRILTNLFRDERSAGLADYRILSKMFLGQIIRADELVEFEKQLRPHQLAQLPKSVDVIEEEPESMEEDGTNGRSQLRKLKKGPETVFDRAVMQHNLLSASKIYNNISFKGLGNLVGLTPPAVEIMARTMIQEKRLLASIDQVDQIITFINLSDSDDSAIVSNVATANLNGVENSSSKEKDELVAVAPSLIKWDESIRRTLQKVETIYQLINQYNVIQPT
ncbi:hypothetical protein O181_000162 [Austropuccinia psidii MF-1]|uniref:COP9 signalosome complex subunit 4 n=1 Tax=Austropuccinia psidii MF-1 TaxID=1389203 RepID=A0A9Q3B864_9BASI|nr:hypothetical protein [Austropuccinia psidii MF-1]